MTWEFGDLVMCIYFTLAYQWQKQTKNEDGQEEFGA